MCFVPGCALFRAADEWNDVFFVNPFHARNVREQVRRASDLCAAAKNIVARLLALLFLRPMVRSQARPVQKPGVRKELFESREGCLKTCRVQNPDIPRMGRIGAHGGVAKRGGAELFANRTVRLGNNPSSHFPKHEKHIAGTSPQTHDQAKFY